MSKIIKFTDEMLEKIRDEFFQALASSRMFDGKISYSKTFGDVDAETTLYITEVAWLKMQTLVREFDKEVAWHGTAERITVDDEDGYIINDIFVYPQVVSGSTVNTDQEKYQTWLYEFDDETFNNIRMQGHSHVNMGVTPSSVDNTFYEELLNMVPEDSFYIFMIWNKRGDMTVKIYDLDKNIMFDTKDVDVLVLDGEYGLDKFLADAKESVKTQTYQAPTTTYYNGYSKQTTYQSTPATSKVETTSADDGKKVKKGKKKGTKPKEEKTSTYLYRGYYDDDDDYGFYKRGW